MSRGSWDTSAPSKYDAISVNLALDISALLSMA